MVTDIPAAHSPLLIAGARDGNAFRHVRYPFSSTCPAVVAGYARPPENSGPRVYPNARRLPVSRARTGAGGQRGRGPSGQLAADALSTVISIRSSTVHSRQPSRRVSGFSSCPQVRVTAAAPRSFLALVLAGETGGVVLDAGRPGRRVDRFGRDARGDGGLPGLAAARWPGVRRAGRRGRGRWRVRA